MTSRLYQGYGSNVNASGNGNGRGKINLEETLSILHFADYVICAGGKLYLGSDYHNNPENYGGKNGNGRNNNNNKNNVSTSSYLYNPRDLNAMLVKMPSLEVYNLK